MSVTVTVFHNCEVGEWDDNLVMVNDAGVLTIYPKGVGVGPSISMEPRDWIKIQEQATAALQKWIDKKLAESDRKADDK